MYAAKDTGFKLNIVLLCIVASVAFGFMIKPEASESSDVLTADTATCADQGWNDAVCNDIGGTCQPDSVNAIADGSAVMGSGQIAIDAIIAACAVAEGTRQPADATNSSKCAGDATIAATAVQSDHATALGDAGDFNTCSFVPTSRGVTANATGNTATACCA